MCHAGDSTSMSIFRSQLWYSYDLYLLLTIRSLALDEIVTLVGQKEVRSVISPEAIAQNWSIARQQQSNDLRNIYCSRPVHDNQILDLVEQMDFIAILPRQTL